MSSPLSSFDLARIAREKRTIRVMLDIYCRAHHGATTDLCCECQELFAYAECRLDRCPFGGDKPTCAKCPIHCYRPEKRAQVKAAMRYAGPRMLLRHPILAILHQWDGLFHRDKERKKRGGPAE